MEPVIVIGNGIAGISCARHLRKQSDVPICIISEEDPYFFSRTALMYVYMGHMPWKDLYPYEPHFWKKNRLDLVQDRVTRIAPDTQTLVLQSGKEMRYSQLVLALGSKPRSLAIPGIDFTGVQGLYHKQDLEQLEALTPKIQRASVIGGGLIGVELAEMLHSRGIEVDFWVRESSFWNNVLPPEESAMLHTHIRQHGIRLHLNTEIKALYGNAAGEVSQIQAQEQAPQPCDFVGVTVGVEPHIDFLRETSLETDRGILVNPYLETSWEGVYAIGDCAQLQSPPKGRRSTEAVWYVGRMMGETLAQTLAGKRTPYRPGPWFNSAKFFDIEYQTYGAVSAQSDPEKESQRFWKHPTANRLIRFSFDPRNDQFLGVNSLGIRLRHAYFDQHLNRNSTLEEVLADLRQAYFDPEFSPQYHNQILKVISTSEAL